jgi:hypothetical protein
MDLQKIYSNLQKFSTTQEKAKFFATNDKVFRKIQLSLADDLDQKGNDAYDYMRQLNDFESKLASTFDQIIDVQQAAIKLMDDAGDTIDESTKFLIEIDKVVREFADAAEAIGINPAESENYKFAQQAVTDLDEALRGAENFQDELINLNLR